MRRRATTGKLARLEAAELGQVRGGISILLPVLGKAKDPATGTTAAMEEITIACEELVRMG